MAKKNLTTLIKELRPFLPGKVEKLKGSISYVIDGKVLVTPDYYCTWIDGKKEDKEEKAKECFPVAIHIEPYASYIDEFEKTQLDRGAYRGMRAKISSISRKRTTKKRVDESFNYETVAMAVTKCLQDIAAWEARQLDYKYQEAAYAKAKKELHKRLTQQLPAYLVEKPNRFWDNTCNFTSQRYHTKNRELQEVPHPIRVDLDAYLEKQELGKPPTYALKLQNLAEEDLWFVLEKLSGLSSIQKIMEGTTSAKAK